MTRNILDNIYIVPYFFYNVRFGKSAVLRIVLCHTLHFAVMALLNK